MVLAAIGSTILITIAAFLVLTLLLVGLLLFTKEKLSPSGPVTITINGERKIEVPSGSSLLSTLGNQKVFFAFSLWWGWNVHSVRMSRAFWWRRGLAY